MGNRNNFPYWLCRIHCLLFINPMTHQLVPIAICTLRTRAVHFFCVKTSFMCVTWAYCQISYGTDKSIPVYFCFIRQNCVKRTAMFNCLFATESSLRQCPNVTGVYMRTIMYFYKQRVSHRLRYPQSWVPERIKTLALVRLTVLWFWRLIYVTRRLLLFSLQRKKFRNSSPAWKRKNIENNKLNFLRFSTALLPTP